MKCFMIKKLYSLISLLFLFFSCTTEEIGQVENQSTDASKISLSFSVDVPDALQLTKAVGNVDKGVETLYLYTFDTDGKFISPTVKAEGSADLGYTAVISKETRAIHFVANDGALNDDGALNSIMESEMTSQTTKEQIFWGKRTFSTVPAKDLSNNLEGTGSKIELLRNWAKITLNLSEEAGEKLKEVSYLIYNESQLATIGYKKKDSPNVPAQVFYAPSTEPESGKFTQPGTPVYSFEHANQGKDGAVIVIKAKFDGNNDYTYYKVDLAVKDPTDHVTRVYDIVRNYAFNITIKSVSRKGLSWEKVIDPNVIADNNITASTIMEKYPNITYDGEALLVTKTTFVFTGSSNKLSMTATYEGKGQLSVTPDGDMSAVVKGKLSYPPIPSGNQTITITADINPVSRDEEVAYFYIVGGNLQRKIKLVLRPAYEFINPRFENTEAENGTNEINLGQKKDVYLKFSVPDIEESLYPVEYKIYTKKLYAVEDGVRLETSGNGEWYYVYTDQDATSKKRVIHFKTNTFNEGESDVVLKADLFNAKDLSYKRSPRVQETKTFYLRFKRGGSNVDNGTVNYSISGSTEKSITTDQNSRVRLSVKVYLDDQITFKCSDIWGRNYTTTMPVSDLSDSSETDYITVKMTKTN